MKLSSSWRRLAIPPRRWACHFVALTCLAALAACDRGPTAEEMLAQARQARDGGELHAAVLHFKNALLAESGDAGMHARAAEIDDLSLHVVDVEFWAGPGDGS